MFLAVALAFVALVVAEIYVIVAVAEATSPLTAVVLLLVTSVLGGVLVRREGAKAWLRASRAVQEGRAPGHDVADGALILFGGVLLFIPGFITDALGLLMVLPPTRRLFRGLVGVVVLRRLTRHLGGPKGRRYRKDRDDTVIDGEAFIRRENRRGISDDRDEG